MKNPDIYDVAERAGVSIKTVSRVLNHESRVRPETRDKVLAAAAALNYRPSISARGLAGQKSYLIALLYENATASFIHGLQEGILRACRDLSFGLILQPVNTGSDDLAEEIDRFVVNSRVDGLILTPPVCDNRKLMDHLNGNARLGVVSVAPPAGEQGLSVGVDDRLAACDMTRHLLSLGHRRIGFIKGHPDHGAGSRRFDGYCDALHDAGIALDPALIEQGYFSFDSGFEPARQLLGCDAPPTAIFAANDDMAAAVMQVALDLGIRVPTELSVVGFDDTPTSAMLWPPLTTVCQPIEDMGYAAARKLIGHLLGNAIERADVLPCRLVVRRSCKSPR